MTAATTVVYDFISFVLLFYMFTNNALKDINSFLYYQMIQKMK